MVVLGERATPREIQSPDYHKLKVVRAEVDRRKDGMGSETRVSK